MKLVQDILVDLDSSLLHVDWYEEIDGRFEDLLGSLDVIHQESNPRGIGFRIHHHLAA